MIRNLFTLRFRRGSIGVETGFVEASTLAKAEEVGRKWCSQEPGRRFISIHPSIIADESILEPEVVGGPEPETKIVKTEEEKSKKRAS